MEPIVYFAKTKENAIIPAKKRFGDGGYDLFACFDEPIIIIPPHDIKLIPIGIASAFSPEYVAIIKERSSTGKLGMAVRAGVIDSNFRGEWKVEIQNTINTFIIISKLSEKETHDYIYNSNSDQFHVYQLYWRKYGCELDEDHYKIYSFYNAIAQVVFLPVISPTILEISKDDLKDFDSERGEQMLGSTNKNKQERT
jgi:dUTP pyrophosphatase